MSLEARPRGCAIVVVAAMMTMSCILSAIAKNNPVVEEDWDFEPRLYSIDESDSDDEWSVDWQQDEHSDNDVTQQQQQDDRLEREDPHSRHYFVASTSKKVHDEVDDNHELSYEQRYMLRSSANGQNNCNQFRVDTREAIICDKKRCDKLKFEWPKSQGQIRVVQTTKHGMRFHWYDLAMQSGQANSKIKLDLLDNFFKPKTTTTSTTTPPTSPTTPRPTEPTTTVPTTTSSEPQDETNATTTSPEKDDGGAKTTTAPTDGQGSTTRGRRNMTRLMTTLRIDTRRRKQRIMGFGGALSDSTCRNVLSLSPQMSQSLMEDYFGANGLRYSFARLSIGSSDFSTTPYTNNDTPQNATNYEDLEMANFGATSEDLEFKFPMVRRAMAASSNSSELKLFASLWSPPIWMKNNSHIVHGYLKGDVFGQYYKSMADYIVKWFELYRREGVEFWGTTGLNEPVTGIRPFIFHNSLGITRHDYLTFMKLYLAPMLQRRGFGELKLMLLDDNKGFAPSYVKSAFAQDPELARLFAGVAIHWYMNDEYENLEFMSREPYAQKFLLSTEACNGYLPFQVHALPGDWDRGVAYAYDIIKTLQRNSVGWVDWNMALDLSGGPSWAKNNLDAPVIVNGKRDEYYKSPMFYALGHFSRFVEPNSVRLEHRLAYARYELPLEVVAFLTPQNYLVIVALNANKSPVPMRVFVDKRLIRSSVTLRAESITTITFKSPSS